MQPISDLELLQKKIGEEQGMVLYFSNESCSVCKVLKPQVESLVTGEFPELECLYVDTVESPLISGQFRVFAIPTILIIMQGKELSRVSRNISIPQLEDLIRRPYEMIFSG